MLELFNFIIIFTISIIVLIALGLVAGFSPTLYVAQIAITSKSKESKAHSIAIMAGVVAAILLLIMLFQTIHVDSLIGIIDTTIHAIIITIVFNVFIGIALVVGGVYYINRKEPPKPKELHSKQTGGLLGIFTLGFARTFISVGSITTTFIAGNVISEVSYSPLDHLVYTMVFLLATIIPFAGIVVLMRRDPKRLVSIVDDARKWFKRVNYQLIIGVASIVFGLSITVFNITRAFFY